MSDKIKELPTEKPLVSYNEKGFVLNYSVTRNEEIAFVDYENDTITFKQMPLPLDRIKEMIKYYDSNKQDHQAFLEKEKTNENSGNKDK
jgi:hypothetical protein